MKKTKRIFRRARQSLRVIAAMSGQFECVTSYERFAQESLEESNDKRFSPGYRALAKEHAKYGLAMARYYRHVGNIVRPRQP